MNVFPGAMTGTRSTASVLHKRTRFVDLGELG